MKNSLRAGNGWWVDPSLPPYEADLTDALGSASDPELFVTVYGHRRNAFGPLYFDGPDPMWIGPNELRAHKTNRRTLVPVGLLAPVEFSIG